MGRVTGSLAFVAAVALTAACTTSAPPAVSGLDLAGFDRDVRAQDDLFAFANGGWLRSTEIPADRSTYSTFSILSDAAHVQDIIDDAEAAPDEPGTETQKIADLYAGFMDTARLEALGAGPLAGELAAIDRIAGPDDLVDHFGHRARLGLPAPVELDVEQDYRNATAYIPMAYQAGLTMPDRDYYLSTEDRYVELREKFRAYAAGQLRAAGIADPDTAATRVLDLQTRLAEAQRTNTANRDPISLYNKFPVAEAGAATPGIDWTRYLAAAGVSAPDMLLAQPDYLAALGQALTTVPLEDWKTYLRFGLIDHLASSLSARFADAYFEFHGRALLGQQEQRPRAERGVALVNETLGEAVGKRYVERHFPPQSKERMDELVANLIAEFHRSIDGLDWMSEPTKAQARDKLSSLAVKIGYPEQWKDYSALEIRRDDLVGNKLRSAEVEHEREIARLGKPVDRDVWLMTPQTVNAYYNPNLNEIVFPAAILQPPFFDAAADPAVNYGGIGAVIGHEVSHAFDDQGSKFDGTGNLRDWWTPQDLERFTERTAGLVAQYGAYSPLEGATVNGELTLGENIADLSGLAVALRAYRHSLRGAPAPEIDGFTGPQRFFLGWAQIWRQKTRDDAVRQRLLTDPHSPGQFRTNGVVTNVPGFHEAFGVIESDRLFRPAEQRIRIW
ncbi:M13 family metallopeptidase [Pseudonocardia bannensis]|uniref:M13 family metallopeptidase n=1 Tax=Pseudonocardia bannensis TaxID=630973 RepID=UPI0028A889F7|nr:M13 family metallopeptidase [Pseudonocardia bannensis]